MTTILIIDDQASNRRILAELAASIESGVNVAAFADPLEALAYAAENTPDLVITDFKMVTINGDEFIRRFRHVPSCADVPTVIVTAYQDSEFRDRAIEAGSTDFLLSPIDHQEFRLRSRSLLALRRQKMLSNAWSEAGPLSLYGGDISDDKAVSEAQIAMVTDMLRTVNSHLVETLSTLDSANNDLQNLIHITQIAAIFVDSSLLIRRFTPPVTDIYNLKPADIGRPLTKIENYLAYDDLEADFTSVRETREALEKHLSSPNRNAHYTMRLLPYRLHDNSIDGAAITFTKVNKWHSGFN